MQRRFLIVIPVFALLLLEVASSAARQSGPLEAFEAAARGRYDESIESLKPYISGGKAPEPVWVNLSQFYIYDNQIEAGRAFFSGLIANRETSFEAYLALAVLENESGNAEAALDTCMSALRQGATSARSVALLIQISLALDKAERLPQILHRLKSTPEQAPLYDLGYAIWRLEIGNDQRALSSIEAYLAARPEDYIGHQIAARILNKLGDSGSAKSEYRSALNLIDGPSAAEKIPLYLELAGIYHPGQLDSTNYYLQEALDLAHNTGALKELYAIDRFAMDFYKALKLYAPLAERCREAIRIAAKLKTTRYLSDIRYTLAFAYQRMYDMDRALAEYRKLIAGTNDPELAARCHLNIGRLFMKSDPERALKSLQESWDLAKENRLNDTRYDAQLSMGDLYLFYGDFDEAKQAYHEVVWYAQRTQQHDLTEAGFLRLSQLYRVPGNIDRRNALYFINMADALTRQTFSIQYAPYHRVLQGELGLEDSDIERAEIYFIDAVQLGRETEVFLPVLAGHAGLVRTYLEAEFKELAALHADSVMNYVRDVLWHTEHPAFKDLQLKRDVFEPMVKAYSNAGDLRRIFQTSQLFKGLNQSLDLKPVVHRLALSTPRRWELAKLNYELELKLRDFWELLNLEARDNLEKFTELRKARAGLRKQREELLEELKADDNRYYTLLRPDLIELQQLQSELRRHGSVFVDYFVGDDATFITVVTPSDIFCKRVNIVASYLRDLVYGLSPLFDPESSNYGAAARDAFRMDRAGELYKLLFEPIVPWLQGLDRVIISAEDFLNRLPFEALVTNAGSLTDEYDYVNAGFLVENYAVSYLALADLLSSNRETGQRPRRVLTALGVRAYAEAHNGKNGNSTRGVDSNYNREIQAVAAEIDEAADRLFLDEHATVANFYDGMESSQVVHLSLPAFYNDAYPLFSKIYFRGKAGPDSVEVGDFFNMESSADLFVLSSSKRGFDRWHTLSSESVFLRGLKYSGVKSQIDAEWQTRNANYSILLPAFYSYLKQGQTLTQALQSAKIEFISAIHRNPYYWSGLVLSGDPGPLRLVESYDAVVIALGLIGFFVLAFLLAWQLLRIKKENTRLKAPARLERVD